MKILHTSDWHLGHVLYKYDRAAEQQDFLNQLASIVRQEQPDAMVVSGDVYHTPAPSAATVKMYVEGMLAIHNACPTMTIVVTAGNHDSPSRLESDQSLWQAAAGVHVIGTVARNDDGTACYERNIIAVEREGTTVGYIAAVPYVYSGNFPAIAEGEEAADRQSYYFAHLLDAVKRQNAMGLPVVLMAHLAVSGADFTGHDDLKRERIGTIDTVPLAQLGTGYDYLALGHIHRPQNLSDRARYCGTPLPVSFDEQCEHSVTIATIEGGTLPQLRTIPIKDLKPLHTLPASAPVPVDDAIKLLEQYDDHTQAYIRLNVEVEQYLPGDAIARAAAATAGKQCCFCTFNVTTTARDAQSQGAISYEEFQRLTPIDIATKYYLQKLGRKMSQEEIDMFNQAFQEVEKEENA